MDKRRYHSTLRGLYMFVILESPRNKMKPPYIYILIYISIQIYPYSCLIFEKKNIYHPTLFTWTQHRARSSERFLAFLSSAFTSLIACGSLGNRDPPRKQSLEIWEQMGGNHETKLQINKWI